MRRRPIIASAMFVAGVLAAATPLLGACSSGSADPAPSTVPDRTVPKSGPQPTVVGGAPAPTADPNAPVQVGPIDPGMTRSGEVVVTSIVMGSTRDPIKP